MIRCGILLSLILQRSSFVPSPQVSLVTVATAIVTILLLDRLEMQSRLCNNNGMWSEVENSSCPSQDIVTLWESVS